MPPSVPPFAVPSDPRPLRLRPEIEELATLTEFIEGFAEERNLPVADALAITLAAEELFANTINHGLSATVVEFSLTANESVITATYADDAGMFDPTAFPEADTSLPLELRQIGGLGIHFIRRTMQNFDYQRVDDRNVTTFGRAITRKAS